MVRISRAVLGATAVSLMLACATVKHQSTSETEALEEVPTALPAYQGAKQRILIYPWNISKVDLEKYPYLRQKRIGFGINNRLFEILYDSGRFDLIEEKSEITSRLVSGEVASDYDYIVYPEVYQFGIEQNAEISGIAATNQNHTELGVQIVFVNARTGVTATVGSAVGRVTRNSSGDVFDDLEQLAFSQSSVGKAADKAIMGALSKALTRLASAPTVSVASTMPSDPLLNRSSTLAPGVKNSVIVRQPLAVNKAGGKNFAFVIGNNEYGSFPKLKTALSDAEEVERVLREEYGYQTQLLLNGTRQTIIDRLDKLRHELSDNDNLIIYYAGHGYYDNAAERGYWLPVNSTSENTSEWISNPDITDKIKALKARGVLVVADSCFSGTLTRGLKIVIGSGSEASVSKRTSIDRNKKSRTALASGGVEPVLDGGGGGHSVFAKAFLDVLSENKSEIDGNELYHKVYQKVKVNSPQTPEYSDIKFSGHDGGDFVLSRIK